MTKISDIHKDKEANALLVNNFTKEQANLFFNRLIDVLADSTSWCDEQAARKSMWNDRKFVQAFVPSFWSDLKQLQGACSCFIQILYDSLAKDNKEHELKNKLSPQIASFFDELSTLRRNEILAGLLSKCHASQGNAILLDWDYSLSVVLCTNDMTQVNQPLCRWTFQIGHQWQPDDSPSLEGGDIDSSRPLEHAPLWVPTKNVTVEMTKSDLENFLVQLKKGRAELKRNISSLEKSKLVLSNP